MSRAGLDRGDSLGACCSAVDHRAAVDWRARTDDSCRASRSTQTFAGLGRSVALGLCNLVSWSDCAATSLRITHPVRLLEPVLPLVSLKRCLRMPGHCSEALVGVVLRR